VVVIVDDGIAELDTEVDREVAAEVEERMIVIYNYHI